MFALRACSRAMVLLPPAAALAKTAPAVCAAKVHSSAPRPKPADRYDSLDSSPELKPLFENNRKWVSGAVCVLFLRAESGRQAYVASALWQVEECLKEDPEFFAKLQVGARKNGMEQ